MSARSLAAGLIGVVVAGVLAPGLACAGTAKPAAKAGATTYYDPWKPDNIKRVPAKLQKVAGISVTFTTMKGEPFKLSAFNPSILLLKNLVIAGSKQFQPGDKVIVYYNQPPKKGEMKIIWAVTDARSELVLAEMRAKPLEATFKSYDAANRKLTVQAGGRTVTYPLIAPIMVVREADEATLGAPPPEPAPAPAAKEKEKKKEKKFYAPGDKMLLVRTLDGKKVRMVIDKETLDRFAPGIKKFPLPPVSQIPK